MFLREPQLPKNNRKKQPKRECFGTLVNDWLYHAVHMPTGRCHGEGGGRLSAYLLRTAYCYCY